MVIEPSGVVLKGVCEIRSDVCIAKTTASITAVWTLPQRTQVNVCKPCLDKQIRDGVWEVPGAKISPRFDAVVYDRDGKIILAVEVKSTRDPSQASDRWARTVRRNLVAHYALPSSAPFMLVTEPGHFFLWTRNTPQDLDRNPDLEFDLDIVPASTPVESPAERTRSFENAVAQWLMRLTDAQTPPEFPAAQRIAATGLLERLRGGRVVRQEALSGDSKR